MKKRKFVPLRLNVLLLVGAGYVTVIIMFCAMTLKGGMTPEKAYEVIQGPLMALIGGSLAISKDLIPLRDPESPAESPRNGYNGPPDRQSENSDSEQSAAQ